MADALARPGAASSARRAGRPRTLRFAGTYFVLIIGAAVAIVPFLYTVSVSLMNLTEANGGAWLPSSPQWKNYIDAWNQANFSRYFWNSVRIAAITVSGELVFCTLAAYAFARMEFWGKNLIFSLLLATLMLPEAIIWVPNFITVSWLGRVGPIAWINNWPALTIPFMASAFSIFLLRQFFMQVPNDLWDSAQIDGAGHLRYLLKIMIGNDDAGVESGHLRLLCLHRRGRRAISSADGRVGDHNDAGDRDLLLRPEDLHRRDCNIGLEGLTSDR
jgi:ABC-type glycerol-3-phosphate transport system permease component